MNEVLNALQAAQQRDLVLAMDDALQLYSTGFRNSLTAGSITGQRLWPHFVLAHWWNIHVAGK